MSIESVKPSNHLILCRPPSPALNLSQHQGLCKWVSSLHQVAKVLEFQLQHQSFQWIQGWFPLGLTGLISLFSKGLSRVPSSTTIQKHQFFGTSGPTLTSYLYLFFLRKIFWACHEACGLPVPWPGIESGPSSVRVPTTGLPGNSLIGFLVRTMADWCQCMAKTTTML